MKLKIYVFITILVVLTTTHAQSNTGIIRGTVTDQQGLAVPGVTVTVTSPALQGQRVVVTDAQGLYSIPALPAGTYTVRYELSGFSAIWGTSVVWGSSSAGAMAITIGGDK